jgi:hypothetical protein
MSALKFTKQPVCERCNAEPATSFSYFKESAKWMFTGACTTDTEHYYIEFERFFASPSSTVDWLAHMDEKGWMRWPDFMAMMRRFRKVTDSFNSIG